MNYKIDCSDLAKETHFDRIIDRFLEYGKYDLHLAEISDVSDGDAYFEQCDVTGEMATCLRCILYNPKTEEEFQVDVEINLACSMINGGLSDYTDTIDDFNFRLIVDN